MTIFFTPVNVKYMKKNPCCKFCQSLSPSLLSRFHCMPVPQITAQTLEVTCFATLQRNKFKSNVARFASHVQTCLTTNQVVAGCENLLQKVDSSLSYIFCNKICTYAARFTGPRQTCFAASLQVKPVYCVTCAYVYPVTSQYSEVA